MQVVSRVGTNDKCFTHFSLFNGPIRSMLTHPIQNKSNYEFAMLYLNIQASISKFLTVLHIFRDTKLEMQIFVPKMIIIIMMQAGQDVIVSNYRSRILTEFEIFSLSFTTAIGE